MTNPILNMLGGNKPVQQAPEQNNSLPTSVDDPRLQTAIDYVNSHGGDPKSAFFQLCKEKALNPANIINMFMGR